MTELGQADIQAVLAGSGGETITKAGLPPTLCLLDRVAGELVQGVGPTAVEQGGYFAAIEEGSLGDIKAGDVVTVTGMAAMVVRRVEPDKDKAMTMLHLTWAAP